MGRNIRIACLPLIVCLLSGGAIADFPQRDRGKLPYRPRWVTVLKKKGLFHYKRKEFSSPRILGDRVYVGSDAGFFYAIGKKNGRNADLKAANFIGVFVEGLQGNDVRARIVPIPGILDDAAGPAPPGAFPRAIRLVE
jgi:hypothetical protein